MIPSLGQFLVVLQLYFIHEFSFQRAFYVVTVLDLEKLYHLLGIDDPSTKLFPEPHTILCTTRVNCVFCPDHGHPPTLRRHREPQVVHLLDSRFRWVKAELYVAYCARCHADFYPDRITYHRDEASAGRIQKLEYDAAYLRVSKHGIWIDRRVAVAQENAILRFHSGWANFAEWLSDTIGATPRITTRQSQRLYFEHFARRLISAHGLEDSFTVPAHSSAQVLVESIRDAIGKDGGVVAGSMEHGCTRCTHLKRYTTDLLAEGAILDQNENGVVDAPQENADPSVPGPEISPDLPVHPRQQVRAPSTPRGYTRLAVMDGKTISHRICAISICEGPLVNYKNGRFCKDHLEMSSILHSAGAEWHQKYLNRFSRLSFPGQNEANMPQTGPTLHSELPDLQGTAGDNTVQWSCGCPIGWGKCYRSESSSQVLKIIDKIWEAHPDCMPSFLAYDDACNLLRHIVTQHPNSPWIHSAKLIVDAWHYIGHRASDILCRIWCNPAPTNGSQPDLISVTVDNNETAEQLNAWLNGYEAQLRQMSNINYDFALKDEGLTEEFWDMVDSTD
ncbi:hypothetical protein B0H13DRAFT_2239147 [Mycena leptocephala]|nr:hypothetical protein B0H13DRAFT_2239147 [Mycena leptocephala]